MKQAVLCYFLAILCVSLAAQPPAGDSLRRMLATASGDSVRAEALNALSKLYMFSQPDTAWVLAQEARRYAEAAGDWNEMAAAELRMGISHSLRGNFPDALQHYENALELMESAGNRAGMANPLMNIGNIYADQGDYPKALEHYLESLEIKEEAGDPTEIALALDNIGIIYSQQKDYPTAMNYFERSLKLRETSSDFDGLGLSWNNMGVAQKKLGNFDAALENYKKSLHFRIQSGNRHGIASCLHNIGSVFGAKSELDSAMAYFEKALLIKQELDDKQGIAIEWTAMAENEHLRKHLATALRYGAEGLKIAQEIGSPEDIKNAHIILSEVNEDLGNTAQAFAHYKSYITFRDSLYNEDRTKELTRTEMRYEFEKVRRENEIRKATAAAEAKKQVAERNNRQYLLITGIFVVLMIPVVWFGRKSKNTKVRFFLGWLTLLIFFEFLLVVLDPWIEKYSGGVPIPKLGINIVLAAVFTPVIQAIETRLKQRKGEQQ